MNFISYWFSDKIVLRMYGAQQVTQSEAPELYGVVAANLGTDLAIGILMSSDAFGPISDNAQGIEQMAGLAAKTNGTLEILDATGNTTKAYAKAFATASGTVSTVVLFATYSEVVGLWSASLGQAFVFGVLIGAAVPFLFSSFAIQATARGAFEMVNEVRRQLALLRIRDEVLARGIGEESVKAGFVDVTDVFAQTKCRVVRKAVERGGRVLAVVLPGFGGLVGVELLPNLRFGTELSDYARFWGGVGGIFHTDELPNYGISQEEVQHLRQKIKAKRKKREKRRH
jgi:hypothetical protein